MSRVVVTGASGFIGRHVVRAFLEAGHNVVGIGRSIPDSDAALIGVDYIITDYSVRHLKECLLGASGVIHLAGRRSVPGEDMELVAEFAQSNLSMLDGILRASLDCGVQSIVQASSIAVYSRANPIPYREDCGPVAASNYGLAKLFGEQYADWWSAKHTIPVAHLRLAACYGAEEKLTPALMKISDRAFRNLPINLSNEGRHGIDEIYVRDTACAFLTAFEKRATGPFNIGAGRAVTLNEIAHTANAVFGNEGSLNIKPLDPDYFDLQPAYMDITKAGQELGWSPSVALADGMEAMRRTWSKAAGDDEQ